MPGEGKRRGVLLGASTLLLVACLVLVQQLSGSQVSQLHPLLHLGQQASSFECQHSCGHRVTAPGLGGSPVEKAAARRARARKRGPSGGEPASAAAAEGKGALAAAAAGTRGGRAGAGGVQLQRRRGGEAGLAAEREAGARRTEAALGPLRRFQHCPATSAPSQLPACWASAVPGGAPGGAARPGQAARSPPPYRTGAGGRQPGQRPPRPLRHLPALPVLQDCPPWWADEPVDAIFAWYNASDPAYQAALRQHRNGTTVHNVEPNTGEIYLSIASVQRYAPWFRRIFVAAPANQSIRWVIPLYCWAG